MRYRNLSELYLRLIRLDRLCRDYAGVVKNKALNKHDNNAIYIYLEHSEKCRQELESMTVDFLLATDTLFVELDPGKELTFLGVNIGAYVLWFDEFEEQLKRYDAEFENVEAIYYEKLKEITGVIHTALKTLNEAPTINPVVGFFLPKMEPEKNRVQTKPP